MASEVATDIPDDVASMWKTLDPAVRAALIASESKEVADEKKEAAGGGVEGRRAKASDGPRMDDTPKFIGGDSFTKRTSNPLWIKVRSNVYDAIKERRQQELETKVPADIEVTMPDGKILSADKVSSETIPRSITYFILSICFSSRCAVVIILNRRETSTNLGALHHLKSHAPYLVV